MMTAIAPSAKVEGAKRHDDGRHARYSNRDRNAARDGNFLQRPEREEDDRDNVRCATHAEFGNGHHEQHPVLLGPRLDLSSILEDIRLTVQEGGCECAAGASVNRKTSKTYMISSIVL